MPTTLAPQTGRAGRRRFGIRAKSLSGLAVLLGMLLFTTSGLVVESWVTLRHAKEAEQRNSLAGDLARVALDTAVERGVTNGVLTSADPASPEDVAMILQRRAASQGLLQSVMERVARDPTLLASKDYSDLAAAATSLDRLRSDGDAELTLALADRSQKTADDWLPAASGLIETIRQTIGDLSAPAITLDAELQTVLEARMAAFDLRNAAGGAAALISGALGSGAAFGLSDAVLIGSRREGTDLHWRRLQRLVESIRDPRLADAISGADRGYFADYLDLLNGVIDAGQAARPYPVDLQAFGIATREALASLDDLVLLTQAISTEMLRGRARSAEFRLFASLAVALAGLGVAGFTMLAFSRRVLRPIERVTDAMRRLAQGRIVAADLPVEQPDEIGEMSRAIAAFRDTIISSEAALADAELFALQTIDALPTRVAVLDEHGLLIAANKNWRESGASDGCAIGVVGQNYLSLCETSTCAGNEAGATIAAGIRSVIADPGREFEFEYPSHSPAGRRWFRVRVTQFSGSGPRRLVVSHDDITERMLAEERLQDRNRLLELAEEMSLTGHWRLEVQTGTLSWSSEIYRIHGRIPQEYTPDPDSMLAAYHPEDRPLLAGAIDDAIGNGGGFCLDLRLFRTDGQLRNVEVLADCEKDAEGRVVSLFGVFHDITDRKKVEDSLADINAELERRVREQTAELTTRESYLRGILENVAEMVMTIDADGRIASFNPAAESAFGYAADEVIGTDIDLLIDVPDEERPAGYIRHYMQSGTARVVGVVGHEIMAVRKDGSKMPVEVTVAEMQVGRAVQFIAAMRDITERRRSERALSEQATLLRRAQDLAGIGHWTWRKARLSGAWHTGLRYSPEVAALFGVPEAELAVPDAVYIERFVHPEDRQFVTEAFRDYRKRRRERMPLEYRIVRPDGSVRHIREVTENILELSDDPIEALGTMQDITERKAADLALRRSEARMRAVFDHAPVTISLRDLEGRYVIVNRRFQELFNLSEEDVVGRTPRQFYPSRFVDEIAQAIEKVRSTGAAVVQEEGAPTIYGDRRYLTTRFPVVDDAGRLSGIGSISVDVSEQRAAEAALRDSEARLRAIYESEPECVALLSRDGAISEINPAGLAMIEAAQPAEAIGLRLHDLVEPDYRQALGALVDQIFDGGSGSLLYELTGLKGSRRWMETNAVPLRDSGGAITAMLTITRDVTGQRNMEDQLRQSQKMEAIGQLTGGVAHDFNNLLGVIVGNLDLLSLKLAQRSTERELVDRAVAAAERGAALTQRLLAFARRQTLLPQQVNAGELVTEVSQLLRRAIGEQIDLTIRVDPELRPCYVDPGQLETALVNLAINARDAMPDGGAMTISAINMSVAEPGAEPGDFVVISVADTGEGMSEEVKAHAFEPFFTTKEVGKGSGLGLSMVYGFVEQSGGHVELESEPGMGTTVSLHLKASVAAPVTTSIVPTLRTSVGDGELVLVVEDDDEMRAFAVDALHRLGYRTVSAVDGVDALSALDENADVAAVFTDVVLAGSMDGFGLAVRIKAARPSLPVLYTSGFADVDRLPAELPAEEVDLLPKPYRIAELGRRLERLLKRESA